jgi:uncharacterized membrane protein YdjX (TVP38/TMEM64 family)
MKESVGMEQLFSMDNLSGWLEDFGLWAVVISLLLNILISILGVVPSIFLSGANAVVFGIIPGFSISLAGEALGAAVAFGIYRWGFKRITAIKEESWKWLRQMNEASRSKRILLLFLARVTPFMPSGVITFAAAVSHMSFLDFIAVTLLGKSPSIAMETIVGHDLFFFQENYVRLLISLLLLSLIVLMMQKKRSK